MAKYHKLKIKEIKQETQDTITVHLKQPLFSKIKYKSGQFITVLVPINGKTERRAYSLCSESKTDNDLMFTVKRVENGLVSNYLNDNLKVGQKLEIMEPMGNFLLEPIPKAKRHIVLFGAGSGITPLMSILKMILFSEPESAVTLIYGNRNESSIIFRDQLNKFSEKYKDRFQLFHVLSQSEVDWAEKGRINEAIIKKCVQDIDSSNAVVFLCGPEGMQDTVRETLTNLGFSKDRIYAESFTNSVASEENVSSDNQTITILLDGVKHSVNVPANESILDAGLKSDLDLPFSCQSGICTACRGKCQTGKVRMSVNDGLSKSELDEGYVLTCVSHPLSDDVLIEIM